MCNTIHHQSIIKKKINIIFDINFIKKNNRLIMYVNFVLNEYKNFLLFIAFTIWINGLESLSHEYELIIRVNN